MIQPLRGLATDADDRELDVLFVSPERFRASPQVGVARKMEWSSLAAYLSRPSVGDEKREAGGYSPGLYEGNVRRKSGLISIGALVIDIDDNGDVDHVAEVVSKYVAIVHETFSSTNDNPRCRLLLRLAEDIDAPTYERCHAIARAKLLVAGVVADNGAKDASRLSFSPVRRPGAGYRFRVVDGKELDAHRVIASVPPEPIHIAAPLPAPEHRDRYVRGALARASQALSAAEVGERHALLCKEAWSLARLGLTDDEIEDALVPAFVAAAGEGRRLEAVRTIRDAVRARRGGAP